MAQRALRLLLVALALASLLVFTLEATIARDAGPLVVVTFSYLKPDLEYLLCGGVVYPLVPPGVDPHEYQLKQSDLDLLKTADLIVTTGHTHFEMRIRELAERGEFKAKVVDALEVKSIRVSINPSTGLENYHLPIIDPVNYMLFATEVASALAQVDPSHASCYYSRLRSLFEDLATRVLTYRYRFSGDVVSSNPYAQYYAEWLGFKVALVLKPEEGSPVAAYRVNELRKLISSGVIKAVFVSKPVESSPESKLLSEIARENGVPVIEVYGPHSEFGVFNSLLDVVSQVERLGLNVTSGAGVEVSAGNSISLPHYVAVALFFAGVFVGALIRRPRGR